MVSLFNKSAAIESSGKISIFTVIIRENIFCVQKNKARNG